MCETNGAECESQSCSVIVADRAHRYLAKVQGVNSSPISVSLKNRRLTEVPDRVLRDAERVHDLDLRRNRLSPVALDNLLAFSCLKSLHLATNNLTQFPLSICSLVNLERLFLNDNHLSALPEEIGNLVKLKVLRICQNQLTAIPSAIGKCSNLESLIIGSIYGGNRLTTIPDEIRYLSRLRELDLSQNALLELPASIGDLGQLQTLNLCGNSLRELPRTIGQLANLRELKVANNRLEALPVEIGNLRNLSVLNVRSNCLTHLPGELAWLKASTSLFLSENPFCEAGDVFADDSEPSPSAVAVPSLRELCGQVLVMRGQVAECEKELPDELAGFLRSARPCTSCRQPFFDKCHKKIEFANLHGHIRVPSMVNLCMPSCASGCIESRKLGFALNW